MITRAFSIVLATLAFTTLLVHSRAAAEESAPQNLPLLSALVQAGGGAERFSAQRLRRTLAGRDSSDANNNERFDRAFTFIVRSTIKAFALPAPPSALADGAALRRALYDAGSHEGTFDVERLFNVLFTVPVHMRQMADVAQRFGGEDEAAYHTVFAQLVAGAQAPAREHHHDMHEMQHMQDMQQMHDMQQMPDSTDLGVGMSREGSGTSWMPDESPVYARMWMKGDDMWMQHGAAWLRYSHAGSERGNDRVTAPNWYMMMLAHPIHKRSQLGVRAMFSLDAATVGGSGYPLLFQTGETWHGEPLHDAQHPHDLVDELSTTYSTTIGSKTTAYLYLAYPGEPALGPPAFMHRATAYDMADAPIGHHWQDATHISFGVATLGVGSGKTKVEASLFNGREPNEVRTNFDPIRLDSSSARLSWNPNAFTAIQVSKGWVKSMEAAAPDQRMQRTTASVLYERGYEQTQVSQALVWGQNSEDGQPTNSYLYEADVANPSGSLFGRIEAIQKTGKDLVLIPALSGRVYALGAYTIGYVRNLPSASGHPVAGIGTQITLNTKPSTLDALYGRGTPLSYELFLRLRGAPLTSKAQAPDREGAENHEHQR